MEPVTQQQETVTKQKNPLRIEQGKKLVEYNKRKKEELKLLNEQITKQDDIADHKPRPNTNNKKRSHTQLDSRKQVIAFQDRVITINIKEAQHPLK